MGIHVAITGRRLNPKLYFNNFYKQKLRLD